jgi:16S rRNA (uracil1498-N3)-methyltransferase
MKEVHLFYAPDIALNNELPSEEATHAVRVLRMKEGDQILVTDGKGWLYECTITLTSPKHCHVRIDNSNYIDKFWRGNIHLAVAPTKNMDRMEWLTEKATEIGFDGIHFLNCKNSERHILKTERIEKIVVSATKQSHKTFKPQVHEMIPFKNFIEQSGQQQKFIAHCHEEGLPFLGDLIDSESDSLILIGPEGDFSIEEVKLAESHGFQSVSLGKSRLRTETAALVAVHLAHLSKRI